MRSWQLKKYKGNDNKPLDLVNTASGLEFPLSLDFPGQKPPANVNWTWYKQTADPDGLGVTYEFSDGHVVVRKVLRVQKNSYLSMVSTRSHARWQASAAPDPVARRLWRPHPDHRRRQPAHSLLRRHTE